MPGKTKEQLVKEEEDRAIRHLLAAGFRPDQMANIMEAIHSLITSHELRGMDHRLLEGDDGEEIRGY